MKFNCPYTCYYETQAGGGSIGPVYRGSVFQKGRGFGNFLRGLFRSILPIFKNGAKAVGKEVLKSGINILGDITENTRPFKDSLKHNLREAGVNLKRKAENKIEKILEGSGSNIRRKKHKLPSVKKKHSRVIKRKQKLPNRKIIKEKDIFN